jgi:hypothetical protein
MSEYYELPVACMNCDYEGYVKILKGTEFNEPNLFPHKDHRKCPNCNCLTLTKRYITKRWQDSIMNKLDDNRYLCEKV